MHSRPFRSLSAVAVASLLLLGLAPLAGAAGEKDKEATKLFDQAMDDYLNAEFAKAEKKLKDAIKKCGGNGCTPGVLGKVHIALGTVYGVGLNKPAEAKDELIAALKADPKAALDPSLSNPDLVKIFDEAKKAAGTGGATAGTGGAGGKPGGSGEEPGGKEPGGKKPPKGEGDAGTHKSPTESVVNTPLPLYFEPSDEVSLSKVTLRYKPFGEKVYKSIELTKMGTGYGGEIPCKDVSTTGDVKYFFALIDENGEAAGTLGSTKDPFKTAIKNEIESDAPTLPGKKPPDQCKEKTDCPPGLPGCPDKPVKRGDKDWGSSCEQTVECKQGLVCLNGSCETGDDTTDPGTKKKVKRFMVGVWGQFDIMNIASKADVCSPPKAGEASNYVCFLQGKKTQFDGTIQPVAGTNGIDGGLKFLPDIRILGSFDFQLLPRIPLTVGARVGVALLGSPTPDNKDIKTDPKTGNRFLPNSNQPVAKAFFPVHYEVRAAYHFGGSMLEQMKFRPYAFVAFGGGQVNGAVPVQVCDKAMDAMGDKGEKCKGGVGYKTTVDAYQITGLNFVGFGGGTTFGITPFFGVAAEVKFMVMVPTIGFVFAPLIAPVFAF